MNLSDWMYGLLGEAPGALIVMVLPFPRCTIDSGKAGPLMSSWALPGMVGYMPSADHTYMEESAPRSSLFFSPVGVSWNSSLRIRFTTAWVFQGCRV